MASVLHGYGYASVERRRAVAIAPLMLASQHDYAWSQCASTFESEYGTGFDAQPSLTIVHNTHKLPVDIRSQLSA